MCGGFGGGGERGAAEGWVIVDGCDGDMPLRSFVGRDLASESQRLRVTSSSAFRKSARLVRVHGPLPLSLGRIPRHPRQTLLFHPTRRPLFNFRRHLPAALLFERDRVWWRPPSDSIHHRR